MVEREPIGSISVSIDPDRMRVQATKGKPQEMWGIVWLDRLPFCFRAWRQVKKLKGLSASLSNHETNWGFVHVPYEPLGFTPPLFTAPITDDDRVYILTGLRIKKKDIDQANKKGEIGRLFDKVLEERSKEYERFRVGYNGNPQLREAYGDAVSLACDEKST